jgi:4-hydroxyphenylpyruvate dioxygenase
MQIDRVLFYVEDAIKWRDWFVRVMGFYSLASGNDTQTQTEVVVSRGGEVKFVLSSPLAVGSPAAEFLRSHPPGVADVAFAVDSLSEVLAKAFLAGVKVRHPVEQWYSEQGRLCWCQIHSNANLTHTLVERRGKTPLLPDDWIVEKDLPPASERHFTGIDHVVLNVARGALDATVNWYEKVLGFKQKQTFTIKTEQSGLYSQVIVHPHSGVQFPINEPRSPNSQIQEFLNFNRGAGIQHIALKTFEIAKVTQTLRQAGLSFLDVPKTYYDRIQKQYPQLTFSPQEWQEICDRGILVDFENINGANGERPLLLQIFTKPIFNLPTFFFELIERRDRAKGFGEGNFQALFEAIEREQMKRGTFC